VIKIIETFLLYIFSIDLPPNIFILPHNNKEETRVRKMVFLPFKMRIRNKQSFPISSMFYLLFGQFCLSILLLSYFILYLLISSMFYRLSVPFSFTFYNVVLLFISFFYSLCFVTPYLLTLFFQYK